MLDKRKKWFLNHNYSKKINVPFAFQTKLSGINDLSFRDYICYHRFFKIPKQWKNDRIILHFGAVDYECIVNINGLYKQAKIDVGGYGVIWNDELDISSNVIFEKGEVVKPEYNVDIFKSELISSFIKTRKEQGLSQKQLEVLSGVAQPIIARVENSQTDPQLSTLIKLLKSLGKKLIIVDIEK